MSIYPSHYIFNIFDLFVLILFLFGAAMIGIKLAKRDIFYFKLWLAICIVHLLTTLYFVIWSKTNSADAYRYYAFSLTRNPYVKWSEMFQPSTNFINFLTYPLPQYCGLSFWGATLVFSFLALLAYYIIIKTCFKVQEIFKYRENNRNFYFLLLLPILHFYTAPIGKDSIIFLALAMVIYGLTINNYLYIIIFLALTGFIRPHIFLLFSAGAGISILFFNKRLSIFFKIIILSIGVLGAYLLMPVFLDKIGMADADITVTTISETADRFGTYNQGGGSSQDYSNTSLAFKMFSYLFRPFFIDAKNVLQLAASFENIFWLIMVCTIIYRLGYLWKEKEIRGLAFSLLLGSLVMLLGLSLIINNLGLAMRQRTMLFPMLFVLYFIVTNRKEIKKIK